MTPFTLKDATLMLVFASVPAGFGHLRVLHALVGALPKEVPFAVLGSQDTKVTAIHRFTSVNPLARTVYEWAQRGIAEEIFTKCYRWYLRCFNQVTYAQLTTLIDERSKPPKTVLVICTHFSLAHEIASLKKRIEREKNIQLLIVVQVTDDSPQKMWFVEGADLTLVPSNSTKSALLHYAKKIGIRPKRILVLPYPVSGRLSLKLNFQEYMLKKNQVDPKNKTVTQIAIPISGAATGLEYFKIFVSRLLDTGRYKLHIISRINIYTREFLQQFGRHTHVVEWVSEIDKIVVEDYEKLYEKEIISLEITKPSEQAFKALLSPLRRGGAVLLLTQPIGRQEYDNIHFLERHLLLPLPSEHQYLWEHARNNQSLNTPEGQWLFNRSLFWRAIRLPNDPGESVTFINWCMKEGIFLTMMECRVHASATDQHEHELASNGVSKFWQTINNFLVDL